MSAPKNMAVAYALKKKAKNMCNGGQAMAEGGMPAEHEQDADMIARIMHKRKMYSQGGMVANDDEPIADGMEAQYDELAKDDHLEMHDTGANSGDEDGSELNQDTDMVGRIMKRRKK